MALTSIELGVVEAQMMDEGEVVLGLHRTLSAEAVVDGTGPLAGAG